MKWNGKSNNSGRFFVLIALVLVLLAAYFIYSYSQQPAPTVTASVEHLTIRKGETTTLSWKAENAEEVYLGTVPLSENAKEVDLVGSLEISPQETTKYIFTAIRGKNNAVAKVVITVVEPPPIIEAKVEPARILKGQKAVLSWQVANASAVEIDGVAWGLTGNLEVLPNETTTYTFKAVGPGGESTVTVEIIVLYPPPVYIVDKEYYQNAKLMVVKESGMEWWVVTLKAPMNTLVRTPISGKFFEGRLLSTFSGNFGDRVMLCGSVYYPYEGSTQVVIIFDSDLVFIKNTETAVKVGEVIAKVGKSGQIFIYFGKLKEEGGNDEEMFRIHFPFLFDGK